jgi:hypothetical protein|tara:strand:+ start:161 stop:691 length:531 start_codon:yes stop_codon:yes gene_type:complete
MKKIIPVLLCTIFVMLIMGSIHSIYADETNNKETYEDDITLVSTKDSKWEIHVQIVVRNSVGQLVGISEAAGGVYVPHKITDNAFETVLPGEITIVTIDDVKYEKLQFSDSYQVSTGIYDEAGMNNHPGLWLVRICGVADVVGAECIHIFQVRAAQVVIDKDEIVTTNWTILRELI